MKKLILILLTLVLFSCIAQKQITQLENEKVNPCDNIVDIDDNPNVLKDCFPNHTTFGIGEGTSPRDSIAIMKATMRSQRDLLSNLKDTKIITRIDSLGNTSVKTNISGVLENVLILKTFISEENGRYKSIVITTGTLGKSSNIVNQNTLTSTTSQELSPSPSSDAPNVTFIPYDIPPKPIIPINPVYPEIAQEAGIEGTIYIQFFIDKKGVVTEAWVHKGIPNTGLDEAALEAVKKSRWKPAQQGDKEVGVWQTVPVKFELTD